MSDPATIATLIGSIVSVFGSYIGYKTAVDTAKAKGEPAPAKSDEVAKGEEAAKVIETGIQQHGQPADKSTLDLFQQHPTRFASALQEMLVELAQNQPAFLAELQKLSQQDGIQPGVQGTATVQDSAKVYGTVAGVVQGSVTGGTFTFGKDDGDDESQTKKKGS